MLIRMVLLTSVTLLVGLMACSKSSDNLLQPNTIDPLNQGLLAYYPFTGDAADASGNENNGLVRGATLTADRFGNKNSAYHLAGGSYILVPELFPDTCPAFTIAVWIKKDTIDNLNHIVFYKGLDQGEAAIAITNGQLGFGVNLLSGYNWYSANMPDTLRANTFYFVVGRYTKGQKVELLINGRFAAGLASPDLPLKTISGYSYTTIGDHPQYMTTYYWIGTIDDIRVYNRSLTDQEVQTLYLQNGWSGN